MHSDKSSLTPTDRLHVLELSNQSLCQDSADLAKRVAFWRREAERARADLQLA